MGKSRAFWIVLVVVVGLAAFALGASGNVELPESVGGNSAQTFEDLPPEFDRVAEVWALLEQEHVDRAQLDATVQSGGAIRGLLQSLEDPYASFLDAEQFQIDHRLREAISRTSRDCCGVSPLAIKIVG